MQDLKSSTTQPLSQLCMIVCCLLHLLEINMSFVAASDGGWDAETMQSVAPTGGGPEVVSRPTQGWHQHKYPIQGGSTRVLLRG